MPRPVRRHEARHRGPGRSPVPSPRTTDTPVVGAGPGAARQSPPVRISAHPWKGHSPCRRPERTSMDSSPSASAVTPASAPRPETAAGDTRRPLTDNVPGGASRPRHVQRHRARPRRTRAARTARRPTPGQGQLPAGVPPAGARRGAPPPRRASCGRCPGGGAGPMAEQTAGQAVFAAPAERGALDSRFSMVNDRPAGEAAAGAAFRARSGVDVRVVAVGHRSRSRDGPGRCGHRVPPREHRRPRRAPPTRDGLRPPRPVSPA